MTLRFPVSPRLHIDPVPLQRSAPPPPTQSDFGTWRAFLRLGRAPRFLALQDAFLIQIDAWRSRLVAIFARQFPRRRHDVEDAVADVIARWVGLVRDAEPLPSPRLRRRRNDLRASHVPWLSLLCGQVREKMRPRRSRSAGPARPPTVESLDALGRDFTDRRSCAVETTDLIDFVRVRARAERSPGEFALLSARLDSLSGDAPSCLPFLTPASERVLTSRVHRWLCRLLKTA